MASRDVIVEMRALLREYDPMDEPAGSVEHGTIVFVKAPRKDGKYPVVFRYLSSGQRLSKLMTLAQLQDLKAKADKDPSYTFQGMTIPTV